MMINQSTNKDINQIIISLNSLSSKINPDKNFIKKLKQDIKKEYKISNKESLKMRIIKNKYKIISSIIGLVFLPVIILGLSNPAKARIILNYILVCKISTECYEKWDTYENKKYNKIVDVYEKNDDNGKVFGLISQEMTIEDQEKIIKNMGGILVEGNNKTKTYKLPSEAIITIKDAEKPGMSATVNFEGAFDNDMVDYSKEIFGERYQFGMSEQNKKFSEERYLNNIKIKEDISTIAISSQTDKSTRKYYFNSIATIKIPTKILDSREFIYEFKGEKYQYTYVIKDKDQVLSKVVSLESKEVLYQED